MTLETRQLIELKDIDAIEVECRQCRAKQIRSIASFKNFPVVCGNCETQLIIPGSRSFEQIMHFVRDVAALSQDDGERFTLKLQLKNP